MRFFSVARLLACFAFAGSFGMLKTASAIPMPEDAITIAKRMFYIQEPSCYDGHSHCIYVTNGVITGSDQGSPLRCHSVNNQNQGDSYCQFPDTSIGYVSCNGKWVTLTVYFGNPYSNFETVGNVDAVWATYKDHRAGPPNGDYSYTNVAGDDLFVTC